MELIVEFRSQNGAAPDGQAAVCPPLAVKEAGVNDALIRSVASHIGAWVDKVTIFGPDVADETATIGVSSTVSDEHLAAQAPLVELVTRAVLAELCIGEPLRSDRPAPAPNE